MQNKYFKFLIIALAVVIIVPQVALASWYNPFSWHWGWLNSIFHFQQTAQKQNPVACTMEAKLCPDGSSVGRQGPKCEFAPCPVGQTSKYFEIKELGIKFKVNSILKDLIYKFAKLDDGTKSVAFTTTSLLAADKDCVVGSIGNLSEYDGTPQVGSWYSYQTPILTYGDLKFYYIHPQAVCANSQDNKKAIDLQGSQTNALQEAIKTIQITSLTVGGDKDAHGCIGSAGYTWCEAKKKCLRLWEEKCQ